MGEPSPDVTRLLVDWSNGDRQAADALMPLVYDELHRRAAGYLRRERPDQTLQSTALVHEVYLRLIDQRRVRWRNRLHFFALAAKLMRRILVDHARGHLAAKRGGDLQRVDLEEESDVSAHASEQLVAIDDALVDLKKENPELHRIVELRFFGGFKNEEIAELLEISIPTITRRWRLAKAWLYRHLSDDPKMEPDRWRRIEELFESVLEQPEAEREAFLDRAAGDDPVLRREVAALVRASERSADFLEEPAMAGGVDLAAGDRDLPREHIGPYRLLRRLGEGGMSQVYLGVRDDDEYQKLVAVKVIRQGMDRDDLLRRFRTERQILAVLDHPNIARLLDGGHTPDGLPYFVMDYVEGIPIDEYCDRNRLSLGDRLELFRGICATVHYAHQNLVVHRDIKASNILVTHDGVVKLLDFGIAKLLKPDQFPITVELTATRLRPMTPYYASPEQIQGHPITTASDVYSLGVLLYKLLTGHLPYRFGGAGSREIERAVVDQEPEPPSSAVSRTATATDSKVETTAEALARSRHTTAPQLRRQLEGDLSNIIMTALRKEPARRYASAEQLSEDIRRYLARLPVMAHRDSLRYRAKKFLARNRAAVAVAAAFLLLLVSFAVTMAVQASRIARERDRAERERDQSERAVAFLQDIFRESDPYQAEEEAIIARKFLDRGAERVTRELQDQPEIQATLMEALGKVYSNLGLYDSAEPLLRQALALRRRLLGGDHPLTAQGLASLGNLLCSKGDYASAEPLLLEALAVHRQRFGDRHPKVSDSLNDLGRLKHESGDYREAERLYREALRLKRESGGGEPGDVANQLDGLGRLLTQMGRFQAAEPLFREALSLRRQHLGDEHPLVALSLNNLGVLLGYTGNLEAAEPLLREALELRRKLFDDDHPELAESLHNLGRLLKGLGDPAGAEPLYRESLEIYRRAFGNEHPVTAETANNLAFLLVDVGDFEGAETLFREALAARRKQLGEQHAHVGASLRGLGGLYLVKGEAEAADARLREALEIFSHSLPEDHWRAAEARSLLGSSLALQGRREEAEALLVESHRVLLDSLGAEHRRTRDALERVIALYEIWEKSERAAAYRALRVTGGG